MTIRVGIVGLGEVAQLMHLPLLADDPRFRIAAVSDVSPGLTEAIGRRYGAELRPTDAERLIASAEVEAVFILTPDQFHAPLLRLAIGAGKHVFLEKPATLTAAELAPLVELPTDRVVFVGYMRRYARGFTELKARRPALERIRHVRIRDLICEATFFTAQTRPVLRAQDVPADALAAGRAEAERLVRGVVGARAGGDLVRAYRVLTGLCSHSISAMRDLLGPPRGIAAAHQRGGETVVVVFDYSGFVCVYEAVISDIPLFDSGIEILTQTERYALTTDTPYIRHLPTRLTITRTAEAGPRTETFGPWHEDAFRHELNAFHDAVAHGARVRTTLADSAADMALIEEVARRLSSDGATDAG